jgi:hypothetical protein
MLWNSSAIKGYAVAAGDGRLGVVSDFLFEDARWRIRWLVVDMGSWLSGRKVLLPVSALGQPDSALRHFPVKLTMQQVKDSPDIDTDRPVSRQMETHVYDYYGWDPYWSGDYIPMAGGMVTPFVAPLALPDSKPRDVVKVDTKPKEGNPHLRSTEAVTGYHIHATDGEIGHVEDFLVDDANWNICYVVVDTRNWWLGKTVLISPRSVREIAWAERSLILDVDRQKVKNSPVYHSSMTIDGAYEERHRSHYGWRG